MPPAEADVGLIFAITGNPDEITALQVGRILQIFVDKALVDIKNGLDAYATFHNLEPDAHLAEQFLGSAHSRYLGITGLYVEHGWEVASVEASCLQEVLRLLAGIGCGGVEVVGACVVAVGTCCLVVGSEVFISDGDALCGFDVDERYGVVWFACSVLLVVLSEVSDAQCLPVDAEVLAVYLMLVARDVYAVDTL